MLINNWNIYNDYTTKKAKLQAAATTDIYTSEAIATFCSMLKYDNLPEDIDVRFFPFLELYKLIYGKAYVNKNEGKFTLYHGDFGGEPDMFGFGKRFVGSTQNGTTVDEDWHKGVVFRNNELFFSDIEEIERYAEMLTQVDISINALVNYSRYAPMASVKDGKVKKGLEDALASVAVGKPAFIQKSETKMISDTINGETSDFEKLDLLDPTLSDKIQYLSKLHDDILRRMYTYIGHALSGSEKMAQQTVDEVTSHDTISMIYPLNRLKCAIEDIEEFNKKFDTNITVDFSDAWKIALGRISDKDDLEEPTEEALDDNATLTGEDGTDESISDNTDSEE